MLKRYRSKQVESVLRQFVFVSQRGSHLKYEKTPHIVIVPIGRGEIPIGTFISILHQAGITRQEFEKALKK